MALNSPTFLLFLALVAALYYALPQKYRNAFLLLASYAFYIIAAKWCALLLAATTVFVYFASSFVEKREGRAKKAALAVSVCVLLAALVFFKYFNFFSETVASLSGSDPFLLKLVLPVGISFYTFQLVAYLTDIYRGDAERERNFIAFALFTGFFPQILSGPIGRAGELLPQYRGGHEFCYDNVALGLRRFLAGAFKKVVVADGLAAFSDGVYGNLADYSGLMVILAVVCYAIQIYCDFSGYTDMALGAAKVLGFTLRENFRAPYLCSSQREFWGCWHMSLMSWFRDYVYIPLGGNRKGFARKLLNLVIVFVISGLWHGAGLNFIVWGVWLAAFRVLEELLARASGGAFPAKSGALAVLGTVLSDLIVGLGWIFFRAESLPDALLVFSKLLDFSAPLSTTKEQFLFLASQNVANSGTYYVFFFGALALGLIFMLRSDVTIKRRTAADKINAYDALGALSGKRLWAVCWLIGLVTMLFYFIVLTRSTEGASFIYLNF